MARNRAGYPGPHTRNDLLHSGWYSGPTYAAFCAYTIDGKAIGDEPLRRRGPSVHDHRFPTKDTELEIVGRILAQGGYTNLAFDTREQPDWFVHFPDGSTVGAEASEIDPSATFEHQLADLNVELHEALDLAVVGARCIFVNFGARAFAGKRFEDSLLPRLERRLIVRELVAYLTAGTVTSGERIAGYPTLERYDMSAYIGESAAPIVSVDFPATCFSPTGPLTTVRQRVGEKIASARSYDRRHPLWLFLSITDMLGEYSATVEAFGKLSGSIAPFEAVFLTDGPTTSYLR